ncbi:MAG TPA: hypothetical protein VFC67_23180 [Prolixibacteraceae bacterium]|nr:hypothetical protein [Prolixibacteraceae bacterium]
MNSAEIKISIKDQIELTNQSFKNYWGKIWIKGVLANDTDLLEQILKSVTRTFKYSIAIAIPFSVILIVFSVLTILINNGFLNWNLKLNNGGLMVLFTIVFLINTYRNYKIKVNLENKIYLLKLLKKINME